MAGSIHALIYVAASSARLWESAIRAWRTALVSSLATFRLWQGFRCKAARFSINLMEASDIQRGGGGRFSLGSNGSMALRV